MVGGGLTSWSRRTRSVNRDRSSNWSTLDGIEASWKNSTITVQSSRDRGDYVTQSPPIDRRMIDDWPGPRSWPDRGLIVARSWVFVRRKLWPFGSEIAAGSKPIRKLRLRQGKPPPRCMNSAPTNASIGHDPRANSPFKYSCISSMFFNFWSIHEEIKQILRNILSSFWFPCI